MSITGVKHVSLDMVYGKNSEQKADLTRFWGQITYIFVLHIVRIASNHQIICSCYNPARFEQGYEVEVIKFYEILPINLPGDLEFVLFNHKNS